MAADGVKIEEDAGDVHESAVFFPDEKMPCRWHFDPHKTCRRGAGCKYSHNEDDSLQALLKALNGATATIDACVFSITCNEIADALRDAVKRGCRVRVISDDDQAESRGSDVDSLDRAGVDVRKDKSPAHMHHKFVIIDNRLLANGSFNWTRSAVLGNRENILFTNHAGTVKAYAAEYEVMWALFAPGADDDLPTRSSTRVDCGDGRVALFFPDKAPPCKWHFMPGKTCRRGDRCTYAHERTALVEFLGELGAATKTIDVVIFNLTNNSIKDALLSAAEAGVAVRIVTDDDQSESRGSDVRELAKKGIKVRTDASRAHMHNKFAVIDGRRLLTGSFNWTRGAVLENRENVYCTGGGIVSAFQAEFDKLWDLFAGQEL